MECELAWVIGNTQTVCESRFVLAIHLQNETMYVIENSIAVLVRFSLKTQIGCAFNCCSLFYQKRSIYRWDPRTNNKWVKLTKLNEFQTELPRDTLVEGEIVQELRGEVSISTRFYKDSHPRQIT